MPHPTAAALTTQPCCRPHTHTHTTRRQLSFNELVALYAITDVALVTSLRDGMNLGGWAVLELRCQHHGGRMRRTATCASRAVDPSPRGAL